jgi:hypothetical protein
LRTKELLDDFFFQRIVNDLLATAHKQILHLAALVQNDKLMGINGAAAPHCPMRRSRPTIF